MGWLFYARSRSQLIEDLIRTHESESGKSETLKWCTKGNNLWSVRQITRPDHEPVRFIMLNLMRNSQHGWGYKDIDETCGPCEVNCPLSYLDGLTEPDNQWAREWRENVRKYHAEQATKRGYVRALKPGDIVTIYGQSYTVVNPPDRYGKLRVRSIHGATYSAKRSQIAAGA